MHRFITVALASALAAALAASGCLTQPPPPCRVVTTQQGQPPYLALLTSTSKTQCADAQVLAAMKVGLQDFVPPGGGAATLALRPGRLVDLASGVVFTADTDAGNNCFARRNCASCAPDGGNPCLVVEEPVRRVDPGDIDGERVNAVGAFAREPTDGVCAMTGEATAAQEFRAEAVRLSDGGTLALPALTARMAFSDVKVVTTPQVQGTAFTAKLTQTEGACVARYDVLAFYPAVACASDADCDPSADLDAGRALGSGIPPDFEPSCDARLGFCVPTVDVTKPGLPRR
ncbi:MAG: hypothetical protein JNJ54_05365 [Myxococcaceae bacterium]|nr:hypothetical protein [Myxococcaceae bacterium]